MKWQHLTKQLTINYRSLTVCHKGLTHPFNHWTQAHVEQGFTWRPESVTFATMESDVSCPRVELSVVDGYTAPSAALRIIGVPFRVPAAGIEITSPVSDSWIIEPPPLPGIYSLFYSIEDDPGGSVDDPWRYCLTLVPKVHNMPATIARADAALHPPEHLVMSAEPA